MKKQFLLLFIIGLIIYPAVANAQWVETINGSSIELGYDIAVDGSGNVFVAGYFKGSNVDFDPGAGTTYLSSPSSSKWAGFLAKYNSSGVLQWADAIKSDFDTYLYRLALDGSNNVYVTGYYTGTIDFDPGSGLDTVKGSGNTGFVAKYSASDGSLVWGDAIQSSSIASGQNLAVDGSGNVYCTGYFQSSADFDPSKSSTHTITGAGNYDIFIVKYAASDGSLNWVDSFGSSGEDKGVGIAVDASSNVFVTGYFSGAIDFNPGSGTTTLTPVGVKDVYIGKYSGSDGSFGWAKRIGGGTGTLVYNLCIDGSSNLAITGYFLGTVNFDPAGSSGDLTSQNSSSGDIFLAKYSSSGSYSWADDIGGSAGAGIGYGVAADGSGNVYLTGYYAGTVDFNPGSGTASKTSNSSSEDIFIAKYSSTGSYSWVNSYGSSGSTEAGYGIFAETSSYVYGTGIFTGTIDFNAGAGTDNHTASSYDAFFGKFNTSSGALPVELTSFTGEIVENTVHLNWETATEINNYGFQVERKSENGNWEKISLIRGSGNSNSTRHYSYIDRGLNNGVYFYRLRQIDNDGKFKFSKEIEINLSTASEGIIVSQNYPNPFNPETTIKYSIPKDNNVNIVLYNMLGAEQEVLFNHYQKAGAYSLQFDGSRLPSGVYFYRVESGVYSVIKKMILLK